MQIDEEKKKKIEKYFKREYTCTMHSKENRAIFKTQKGVPVDQSKVIDELSRLVEAADISKDEVEAWLNELKEGTVEANTTPPKSAIEIFDELYNHTIKKYNATVNEAMTKVSFSADTETQKQGSIDELETYLKVESLAHPEFSLLDKVISTLLKGKVQLAATNQLANLFKHIKYAEGHSEEAEKCLRGMYHHFGIQEDYDIFKVIMYQWVWQVKRKMLAKKVSWPIWPHFYGPAGIGKTTALEMFIDKAIGDFRTTTQLAKIFENTSEIKRMTEYYAWVIDELAVGKSPEETADGLLGADKKAILKSMLTSKDIDARIYGTQNLMKRDLTFSCISSANLHFADVIFDEQTMRRYFEFTCETTVPKSKKEWTERMTFQDYFLDVWLDVDENLEEGYLQLEQDEIGKKIAEIQRSYYPTNTTAVKWLSVYDLTPGTSNSQSEIYKKYSEWCKESGYKPKALCNFIDEIRHRRPDLVNEFGFVFADIQEHKVVTGALTKVDFDAILERD